MTPLISAIVPIYKVEKYLSQCVDSILSQTLTNIEIILVDDGSPDNCPAICDNYAKQDKRIKVIHQPNAGLSAARNTGLNIAKGKYISFIDSDDYIEPRMFETLYNLANTRKAEITVCNLYLVPEDDTQKSIKEYWPAKKTNVSTPSEIFDQFLIAPCWAWNKLYERHFLNKNNLRFIKGILYEDVPFFTSSMLLAKRIAFCSEPLYNYRVNRNGSITVKQSRRHLDLIKVAAEVKKTLNIFQAPSVLFQNFLTWQKYNYIWMYKHIPSLHHRTALKQIETLPSDFQDEIYQYLSLQKTYFRLFDLCNILSVKRSLNHIDFLLFDRIPIFSACRKKK